ncbi:helix-turn-helix domain-containing protein [Ruminococcus sp. FC2018]|uniref:helix-turn-helix domain-containing protein n=1 Tax=Ruminococcus sp. FC2018 TaxID=1410617 RepID=UPI0006886016|nr:helix-turn-helix domain-containing protein [Ruminococcus sp. FC2018]
MSIFSQRLESVMKEKNLRQHQLCEMTGISKSFISSYLAGRFSPKADKLSAISKALGVSEGWLMGYENSAKYSYDPSKVAKIPVKDHSGKVVAHRPVIYSGATDSSKLTFYLCTDRDNFPHIKQGDMILVQKCADFQQEGCTYAIRKDGKITFRTHRFNGSVLVLSAENTAPTIYLDDYHSDIIVMGKVLEIRREMDKEENKDEQRN